jgi:Rrf2 family protein
MQLTRASDYAVRLMIHLATLPAGVRATRDQLAVAAEAPPQFLGKILQSLARAGLILSHRGVQGGFELARAGDRITLLDVVEAMEGPLQLNLCLTTRLQCGRAGWCAAHLVWQRAQSAMAGVLRGATIEQLAVESLARRSPSSPITVEAGAWS